MKKLFTLIGILCGTCAILSAQDTETAAENAQETILSANKSKHSGVAIEKYRRSSLYSVLVTHSGADYASEIRTAYFSIPIPDKFNDHNISVRAFESSMKKMKKGGKKKEDTNLSDVENFIAKNRIPATLVGKWFNRSVYDGSFDVSLIQERGYYDASQEAIAAASLQERNLSILGDAGEDLIGKTFMIVNDITFVDKGKNSQTAAAVVQGLGFLAAIALGDSSISKLGDTAAAAVNEIDGFQVNITTYLYRLVWNNDVSGEFYSQYWINPGSPDEGRRIAFESTDLFKMEYIGQTTTSAANLSSKSFSKFTKEQQMLKVCARAVDKSIVQLQRSYEVFRVNTPIWKINDDGTVEVQIGLKEGVNSKSQYEVLMPKETAEGKLVYNRVAVLKPVAGKIWDNRFGALDEKKALEASGEKVKDTEGAEGNVYLESTTFKAVSGANQILPGCLVREMTIKK